MNKELAEIDWDLEFCFLSAEEAFEHLVGILKPMISQLVSIASQNNKHKLPWKSNPSTSLELKRSSAWSAYKTARSTFGRKAAFTQSLLQIFLTVNKQLRCFALHSQQG